ncbi:phosphoglycerate kinase [Candidatus Parcubacteria bacterium]|nr:phosphoglycerate kinase [Candidatus Parcubacteria bacterium]
MKTIREVSNLKDKKVLLRVDFNVPVSAKGEIEEPFRIEKQKETLNWLLGQGAKVILVSHITSVETFANLIPQLHMLLGKEINFIKSVSEIAIYLDHYAGPALLENIRQNEGEEKNDSEFAKQLATGFDIYINNAFAVCHRNHASLVAITGILPSYAGFLVEQEVAALSDVLKSPKEGKLIIIGGAKTSTKVPVIKNFLDKSDAILLGGVVANDVLKEKGQDMGSSVVDENSKELLSGIDLNDPRLIAPKDFVVFDNKILDIGEQTMKDYLDLIAKAKMIIWNGPMGLFENPVFAKGTNEVAQAISSSSSRSIIGGGDTISALDKAGLLNKFGFISTGGGAMLEFLAGNKLPGLEALS